MHTGDIVVSSQPISTTMPDLIPDETILRTGDGKNVNELARICFKKTFVILSLIATGHNGFSITTIL